MIKIIEQFNVSPSREPKLPETSLPLTFFDLIWLRAGPVERIFFYNLPHCSVADFTATALPNIITSLSTVLQHFFPLAGRLRLSSGSTDQYEIYYNSEEEFNGVPFTVAETEADFDDLAGDHDRDPAALKQLIPSPPLSDDGATPLVLLAVQVTLFPSRGFSLGIVVQHVSCDGRSSTRFLKLWANACKKINSGETLQEMNTPEVIFDRSLIPDDKVIYNKFIEDMKKFFPEKQTTESAKIGILPAKKATVLSTFVLTREIIEKMKQVVISKSPALRCSTFVVACAYVWVCIVKSRNYNSNAQEVFFACAADVRPRLNPPVPEAYFGNCLGVCSAVKKSGELCGEDGMFEAAAAIGKAIEEVNKEPLKGAEGWFEFFVTVLPKRPMSVAGSPRFKVYDIDFGWGFPEKVEVLSILSTGAVSLAESKDRSGGIQVGFACEEMETFRSCFAAGLENL